MVFLLVERNKKHHHHYPRVGVVLVLLSMSSQR